MSSKRLYVGNVPYDTSEQDLEAMFAPHGQVEAVNLIIDRETGRSRGFAFVEMDDGGARAALEALDGADMGGRKLRVSEAHERERR